MTDRYYTWSAASALASEVEDAMRTAGHDPERDMFTRSVRCARIGCGYGVCVSAAEDSLVPITDIIAGSPCRFPPAKE